MTVSSGAFFGIRGRFIGSGIALAIALGFAAVTVWTSGDAIVAAGHRLLGTPENDVVHAIAYAAVAALMVTVALYGHATIVAMQKVVVPVVGTLMVLGVFAFAGGFDPGASRRRVRTRWLLADVGAVGRAVRGRADLLRADDRRLHPADLARRFSNRQICAALGIGMFVGVLLPSLFGAFTALSFANPTDSYLDDLVAASPGWYVLPIVVISLLGGLSQGVLCIYASGLDLEGLAPRLKRTQTTIITAAVAIVLLYVGVFVFDAVESVTAMTVALNAVITPWVAILAIGALRTKSYDPTDLQAFAHGRHGGRYWFTGGWNVPAVVAWTVGAAFGVLAVNTTLYVGPLADIAGGVDLSTIGSAALAGLIYACVARLRSSDDAIPRRTGDRVLQAVGIARPGAAGRLLHRRRRLPQHSDGRRCRVARPSRSSSRGSPPHSTASTFRCTARSATATS